MSDVPKKLVVDIEAGTKQYIDLTPEEIEQRELDSIAFATAEAERETEKTNIAQAKASAILKLATLGLTNDEISALTK
jgi:hypothetical protein